MHLPFLGAHLSLALPPIMHDIRSLPHAYVYSTVSLDPSQSDVPAIEAAFEECGKGGKIVFSKGTTYHINGLLRMKGCNHCVVEWDGLFLQSADIDAICAFRASTVGKTLTPLSACSGDASLLHLPKQIRQYHIRGRLRESPRRFSCASTASWSRAPRRRPLTSALLSIARARLLARWYWRN